MEQAFKVILVIAHKGYQPVEYGVTKKHLEESGVTVVTASDALGVATATDGSTTNIDSTINAITSTHYDALFVIGGSGAMEYLDTPEMYNLLRAFAAEDKPHGAICIAPRILAKAGVLQGIYATGWNEDGKLADILQQSGAFYALEDVVVDGGVVTASGPQVAQDFAEAILDVLCEDGCQSCDCGE